MARNEGAGRGPLLPDSRASISSPSCVGETTGCPSGARSRKSPFASWARSFKSFTRSRSTRSNRLLRLAADGTRGCGLLGRVGVFFLAIGGEHRREAWQSESPCTSLIRGCQAADFAGGCRTVDCLCRLHPIGWIATGGTAPADQENS